VLLIDDCCRGFYNIGMETKQTEILYTEVAEPRRKIIKSDVVLWLLTLLSVFALMFLGSFCTVVLGVADGTMQIAVYLILLFEILFLYRVRIVAFRYTLTERMFSVNRIVGKKDRPDANIHLTDITRIRDAAELVRGDGGKWNRLYHGKREESVAVTYRAAGAERTLLVSITETMRKRLVDQWKAAKRS